MPGAPSGTGPVWRLYTGAIGLATGRFDVGFFCEEACINPASGP